MKRLFPVLLLLCMTLSVVAQRKVINLQPNANRPFSDAVQVGDTLYLAGTMGFDDKGNLPPTFAEEARNTLNALGKTLKAAGFDYPDVVKVNVYMTDLKSFEEWNKIYTEYFKTDRPARATVQVAALVRGGHVEVEMIAVKRKK